MPNPTDSPSPQTLKAFFRRNGYVRYPKDARVAEGHEYYKKGDEVRLVANSFVVTRAL